MMSLVAHFINKWRLLNIIKDSIVSRSKRSVSGFPEKYGNVQFLDMGKDTDDNQRKVAYIKNEGIKSPGVMMLPGYFAPMTLAKVKCVEEYCLRNGHPFVAYECEGTNLSPGVIKNVTALTWMEDALAVFDKLTRGPQILVSSSFGGWTALLLNSQRPDRVHSHVILGICPFDDYEGSYKYKVRSYTKDLDPEVKKLWEGGFVYEDEVSPGNCIKYWHSFTSETPVDFDKNSTIPVTCPIRLVHAKYDDDVPYYTALEVAKKLESTDVDIIIKKDANHRLMKVPDQKLIVRLLNELTSLT